jgi:hypothetical protein
MAELKQLVSPGVDTNRIVAALGHPDSTSARSDGSEVWRYWLAPFPAQGAMSNLVVIGVAISLTNGVAAFIGCSYAEPSSAVMAPEAQVAMEPEWNIRAQPTGGEPPELAYYRVSREPIPGGRQINTEHLPNLGYVGPVAGWRAKAIRDASRMASKTQATGGRVVTNWSIKLSLSDRDVPRFAAWTRSNLFERVVMLVGDVPVWVGGITGVVEGNPFQMEVGDDARAAFVEAQIGRLQQETE